MRYRLSPKRSAATRLASRGLGPPKLQPLIRHTLASRPTRGSSRGCQSTIRKTPNSDLTSEHGLSAGCPVARAAGRRAWDVSPTRQEARVIAPFRLFIQTTHRVSVQATPRRGQPGTKPGPAAGGPATGAGPVADCHPGARTNTPRAACGSREPRAVGCLDAPGRTATHRTTGLANTHSQREWALVPQARGPGDIRNRSPGKN